MVEYEINESTQLIKPINNNKSIICEENTEYEINNSSNKIIKYNCSFYGSSYIGRCEGTKALTGIKTKFPIIIEESRNIIFFPTSSVRSKNSFWLSLNKIKSIKKKDNGCTVVFNNGRCINLPVSYYSLNNQYYRATMLKAKLYERKKEIA